jgi:ribosomal protein L21E
MRLDKAAEKIGKVMGEWKDKDLHSGKGGKVVKSRKQAIAIALSEANKVKGK